MRLGWVALLAGCGFKPTVGAAIDAHGGGDDAPPMIDDAPRDAASNVQPACMTSGAYTTAPQATHRYRVMGSGLDRDGAFDACAADGAHLATLETAQENTYVRTIANDVWIGLDDLTTEATFKWVTGATPSFYAWATGEPNNANGTEDCVYLKPDAVAAWNDTNCGDTQHGAVCECELGYVPPAPRACRTMSGSQTINGRRYFVRSTSKTWQLARDDCASIGAYLMVPSDTDENAIVESTLGLDVNNTVWIGLSDLQVPGTWAWIDTAPLVYQNWTTGAPFAGAGQDCVAIQKADQKWANLSCTSNQSYVCECDPDPP